MALMTRRAPFLIIAGLCVGLLAFGYFLQFHSGQEPCPLCIFQRICYFAIGLVGIVAGLQAPRYTGTMGYGAVLFLSSSIGAGIAGRQVWLQHLPGDQIPECGPGLDFLLEMYPLTETIRTVLRGSGDCAKVDWTFLGMSVAEWSLLCFLGICATCLYFMYQWTVQRPLQVRPSRTRRRTRV